MIVFTDPKTQLGLLIGTFFASLVALFIPHTLIGGCASMEILCHRVAFPALTAESIILLIFSTVLLTIIALQKPSAEPSIRI